MTWTEIGIQIAVAGLSAFGGALAAFLLERRRDREKQVEERYLAARFARELIRTQCRELLQLDSSMQPFKGREDSWQHYRPDVAGSIATRLNIKELSFVLEGSDPGLLSRLIGGQQQYDTIRTTLRLREQAHVALQSRVASLIAEGADAPDSEDAMHQTVGLDIVGRLKSLTHSLFEIHPLALKCLDSNLIDLRTFIEEAFPKKQEPRGEVIDHTRGLEIEDEAST